jgi:hypothetical protein
MTIAGTCHSMQQDPSSNGTGDTTSTAAAAARVLVIGTPKAPEFSLLQQLPAGVVLLGVGQSLADFGYLTPEQWASCDVVVRLRTLGLMFSTKLATCRHYPADFGHLTAQF